MTRSHTAGIVPEVIQASKQAWFYGRVPVGNGQAAAGFNTVFTAGAAAAGFAAGFLAAAFFGAAFFVSVFFAVVFFGVVFFVSLFFFSLILLCCYRWCWCCLLGIRFFGCCLFRRGFLCYRLLGCRLFRCGLLG